MSKIHQVMKSNLKVFLFLPFLMAFQCEEDEIQCVFAFTNNYNVSVENINETYSLGEMIWFNGSVSSELVDSCNNEPEVILDRQLFATGFFVLKLTNNLNNLNALLAEDYNVTLSTGEAVSSINCVDFVHVTPELSADNLSYNYRVGISLNEPGDYCVVAAFQNNFDLMQLNNNAQIFEPYNSLNDTIKFISCGDTFTRNGTSGHYFFTVN